jgi:hypothetical protein
MTTAPVAAPLATSLLSNNGTAPASSIAGSSGALPALALAGAAGAAGMALGQKSAASSSLGSPAAGVEGPVMTPNNKASGTEFAGNDTDQGAPLPAGALGSEDGAGQEDKNETAGTTTTNGAAFAAATGGGASVMPSSDKQKTKREVASEAANASFGGEEALTPFSGDLRPAPRPAASNDSAGNDVSNLLGKMKDLFNLDENFGMDSPPPDMFAGGSASASAGTAGNNYPAGDEYTGEEEYQAEEEYGESDDTYQGASPMGDIEVTLFRRVHARHVKCLEKGLVILLSQDLPE